MGSIPSLATVTVAQLVRASDCGSEGRRFNSASSPHAFVAQLVEHFTCNEDVAGSTPVKGSSDTVSDAVNDTVNAAA